MSHSKLPSGFHRVTHDRPVPEQAHDPYQARGKYPEPTVCPQCKAVFHEGRWRWGDAPARAHAQVCPACHRIADQLPAGFVSLSGPFLQAHRAEILSLVRHQEQRARQDHPLQRIIGIEEQAENVLVTTTDIHLARALGEALRSAYQGELEFHYNPEDYLLRVHWTH